MKKQAQKDIVAPCASQHRQAAMPLRAEFCRSHLILRNLRPAGSKEYVIPKGFAFDYITCANYTFEIYGWILFGVATQTVAAFLFIAAGSFPMSQWALGKHARLRKVGNIVL